MEGYCSTGQSPQWAVVPMEEEEEEEEEYDDDDDDDDPRQGCKDIQSVSAALATSYPKGSRSFPCRG